MTTDPFDVHTTQLVPATLGPIQEQVFWDRYARKSPDGVPIERHPEEMWRRVADAVAHALIRHAASRAGQDSCARSPGGGQTHTAVIEDPSDVPWASHRLADLCPQCGHAALVAESGCFTCHACGYSSC
jgi:hypothetical protein